MWTSHDIHDDLFSCVASPGRLAAKKSGVWFNGSISTFWISKDFLLTQLRAYWDPCNCSPQEGCTVHKIDQNILKPLFDGFLMAFWWLFDGLLMVFWWFVDGFLMVCWWLQPPWWARGVPSFKVLPACWAMVVAGVAAGSGCTWWSHCEEGSSPQRKLHGYPSVCSNAQNTRKVLYIYMFVNNIYICILYKYIYIYK